MTDTLTMPKGSELVLGKSLQKKQKHKTDPIRVAKSSLEASKKTDRLFAKIKGGSSQSVFICL